VLTALNHIEPDRVPVDFLATPEVFNALVDFFDLEPGNLGEGEYFDPGWEALLRKLEVDCRLVSYDQFCRPPGTALRKGAREDWWGARSRSTPNRMWRQITPEGDAYDIWGHHIRVVKNPTGSYEENASWPLSAAGSVEDLKSHPWPQPDWWDFSPLPGLLEQMDQYGQHHIRFRVGSVFEVAWQLRGMQEFLVDMAVNPGLPLYIMDRMTEVCVENTRRVLELAGDRLDMVYFFDDVATQQSLMVSKKMWREHIRPRHERIIEVAKTFGKQVMYHCDGAIAPLIPELVDMGVDLLNPVQADAKGMEPEHLKAEFGHRLSFHGGIDIIETLPHGTLSDVQREVQDRVGVLGVGGGYILASSHHIQSDTPIDNVLAMYDPAMRYKDTEDPN
jgi:uroporphyrinogen decarboxylase